MRTKALILSNVLTAICAALPGGPRSSADYSISTDTTDAGGKRTAPSAYTSDGIIAGISALTAPTENAKRGYIGQLYEVAGHWWIGNDWTMRRLDLKNSDGGMNQQEAASS